ncbi:MAG: hypothetical protein PHP45_03560 [Elusimicrobiales bacterium]|nr:hypothetical protein [Elusimicrobiales bacterium]
MGIYIVKKPFAHYDAGATVQLSAADAEKYKAFIEPAKIGNKKTPAGNPNANTGGNAGGK